MRRPLCRDVPGSAEANSRAKACLPGSPSPGVSALRRLAIGGLMEEPDTSARRRRLATAATGRHGSGGGGEGGAEQRRGAAPAAADSADALVFGVCRAAAGEASPAPRGGSGFRRCRLGHSFYLALVLEAGTWQGRSAPHKSPAAVGLEQPQREESRGGEDRRGCERGEAPVERRRDSSVGEGSADGLRRGHGGKGGSLTWPSCSAQGRGACVVLCWCWGEWPGRGSQRGAPASLPEDRPEPPPTSAMASRGRGCSVCARVGGRESMSAHSSTADKSGRRSGSKQQQPAQWRPDSHHMDRLGGDHPPPRVEDVEPDVRVVSRGEAAEAQRRLRRRRLLPTAPRRRRRERPRKKPLRGPPQELLARVGLPACALAGHRRRGVCGAACRGLQAPLLQQRAATAADDTSTSAAACVAAAVVEERGVGEPGEVLVEESLVPAARSGGSGGKVLRSLLDGSSRIEVRNTTQ